MNSDPQPGADVQPGRYRNPYGRRARDGPQHEPRADGEHVQQYQPLDAERVGGGRAQVHGGYRAQERLQGERGGQAERGQDERARPGRANGQPSRRDGPVALERMLAVAAAVQHVVSQIDRAAQRAEDREGGRRLQRKPRRARRVVRAPSLVQREQRREIDDKVLRPLARAQRARELQGQRGRPPARLVEFGLFHAVMIRAEPPAVNASARASSYVGTRQTGIPTS